MRSDGLCPSRPGRVQFNALALEKFMTMQQVRTLPSLHVCVCVFYCVWSIECKLSSKLPHHSYGLNPFYTRAPRTHAICLAAPVDSDDDWRRCGCFASLAHWQMQRRRRTIYYYKTPAPVVVHKCAALSHKWLPVKVPTEISS